MDAQAISKFIGVEESTDMGHLKQIQQGNKSTTMKSSHGKQAKLTKKSDRTEAIHNAISVPTQEPKNKKTTMVFMLVQIPEGFIASEQTRIFHRMSHRGMKYICMFCIQNPNYKQGIPIKSRKEEELLRVYKEVYAYCESRGFKPQLQKMDNETSKYFEDFYASQKTDQQYTPQDMYQTNPTEQSIQTYNSCIKSTVASLPPTFPIAYWCRLIPQVDFSINIVRK